jgi:hypothetical protein
MAAGGGATEGAAGERGKARDDSGSKLMPRGMASSLLGTSGGRGSAVAAHHGK